MVVDRSSSMVLVKWCWRGGGRRILNIPKLTPVTTKRGVLTWFWRGTVQKLKSGCEEISMSR